MTYVTPAKGVEIGAGTMTVCVSVVVHDGLVFAADSAATLVHRDPETNSSEILNVYQHGYKVFALYKTLPIAAMTCGMGNIGPASIGTLAKELRRRMMSGDSEWHVDPINYTIGEIAEKARRFLFEEKYKAIDPPLEPEHSLEFWIGGYPSDHDHPHEIWKFSIINGACDEPESLLQNGDSELFHGGQPGPINRLVNGLDLEILDAIENAGVDALELSNRVEARFVQPNMPIQDAIDLADFLVDATKRYFRFLPGADIVGGETDIAVVTKYEGFKWIRRKNFYPMSLNPLETKHGSDSA